MSPYYYFQILRCTEVDPIFKPVIDGRLLERTPQDYLRGISYPPMPYMTGTVRAEFGQSLFQPYALSLLRYIP